MRAIGLMSGTSLDGVDAAVLDTDGVEEIRPLGFCSIPYADDERRVLQAATVRALRLDRPGPDPQLAEAVAVLTRTHLAAVRRLLDQTSIGIDEIDLVGFHGQTVAHRPDRGWTWQLGDGAALAAALGVGVVDGFRTADVAAGGEGAPLLPAYHRARLAGTTTSTVVLNLGGIANITFVPGSAQPDAEPVAFDTGPANGLVDDWMAERAGGRYDVDGRLAAAGSVDRSVLSGLLAHRYFDRPAPKSLDRADFGLEAVRHLSPADGAATLTAFTAASVAHGLDQLPIRPERIVVAGGGRHNPTMMIMIAQATGLPVEPVESLGWNGDATEAEGFGYLAVRSRVGLPITFPSTTGVATPLTGGRLHRS